MYMLQLSTYFLLFLAVLHCGDSLHSYTWTDDVTGELLVCDQCAPGSHLIRHCTKDRKTECGPCPSRHFTEIWNYIEKCLYCNVYCTENQFEKVQCTNRTNRECACKNGFYMRHESCHRHSKCPPGEGVVANGTATTDVTCTPCPSGQFSSESSSTHTCRTFTECADVFITIPGDDRRDVYCSTCKNGNRTAEDQVECDDDLVIFIGKQALLLTSRKLRRLHTALKREAKSHQEHLSTLELLERIKSQCHSKPFVMVMQAVLHRVGLSSLEHKVMKWFS